MSVRAEPAAGADPFDLARLCRYFSERSPQPVVAVGGQTHVVRYLNPAFARLAGKPPDDLIGRPFAEALPEGDGNGCLGALDRVFCTGTPEHLAEQEHRRTPPAYWSYAMWAVLGADDRPAGVMVQVTETTEVAEFRRRVTTMNEALLVSAVRQHELVDAVRSGEQDRRELEARVFQAQKLESLGVLAGGIAHALNNILTPVVGFADLASELLPAGSPAAPMLDALGKNARRAADLVQQVLAYAGKGRFIVRPVDLSRLVREVDGLLTAAVPIDAILVYDLAPHLPPVEADAAQLGQVVVNLVKNAAESMTGNAGIITVRTGLGSAVCTLGEFPPEGRHTSGPVVFLEVEDSGCGMTAEVMERVFEPFFTTKFTGRGLGLAVVQGIARGHRGTLTVRSEPGRGSTFRLLLPALVKINAAQAVPPSADRPTGWRGTGTVLEVDDEEGVRDSRDDVLPRGRTSGERAGVLHIRSVYHPVMGWEHRGNKWHFYTASRVGGRVV